MDVTAKKSPQAAIKYDEDDLPGAKSMVEQCSSDDPDTENNLGLF